MMSPEQRARFQTILDQYDAAIAAVNEADYIDLETLIKADEIVQAMKRNLVINQKIMEANRTANAQVRILLNDM